MHPTLHRARMPILLAAAVAVVLLIVGTSQRTSRIGEALSDLSGRVNELVGVARWHDQEITERVVNLPEDGQAWSSVFVWPATRESDPDSRRLAAAFASEPKLQSLLAQTKVHHYTPSDPMWRTRYAGTMGGATPQFWLIKPAANPSEGTTVYAVAGSAIPEGRQLANQIVAAVNRICPRPKPTPQPTPQPTPVTPPVVPDLSPSPEPIDDSLPLWVWLLPIVAAGAGAIAEWRRST